MTRPRTETVEIRFWQKVEKGENCWLWKASISERGYGKFYANYRYISAHRFSFLLHFGFLPEAVCHHCDVKICVRPDHLFGGTQLDNVRDRDAKGRTSRGPKPNRCGKGTGERNGSKTHPEKIRCGVLNGRAKLTDEQVIEIRRRRAAGETLIPLSKVFGVSHAVVFDICARKNWKHI